MSQSLSQQHPAVVLRSHYVHLRALLAIAMIAVVGLTVAVVILATSQNDGTVASSAPASATAGDRRADDRGVEQNLAAPRSPSTRDQRSAIRQRFGGTRP